MLAQQVLKILVVLMAEVTVLARVLVVAVVVPLMFVVTGLLSRTKHLHQMLQR